MRDKIFKTSSQSFPTIYYHLIFWGIFIIYEITLAAAIRERFNHFLDYFLHYFLNILLFYFHCYFVLGRKQFDRIKAYQQTLAFLVLELISYYLATVVINELLTSIGVPVSVGDTSSRLFYLSVIYRSLYLIGLSTAFWIAMNLLENRDRLHKYITQNLIAEKEKETLRMELVTAELAFLRSQINPHFLFNSLNSLYNRIRKNDPQSAEYVLALAELMQYALTEQAPDYEAPIECEIEHISNYLKLQQMRYSREIDLKISNQDPELRIIPLLLITLIENIFKHGDLSKVPPPVIEISTFEGKLTLLTRNYIRTDPQAGKGVGLTNSRKRLELHYPNRYTFEYGTDKNIFTLKLTINLK